MSHRVLPVEAEADCAARMKAVAQAIAGLDKPGFPHDGICSHFGYGLRLGTWFVHVGRAPLSSHLLVTIYDNPKSGRTRRGEPIFFGHAKATHSRHRKCLAEGLKAEIATGWNGKRGHAGVSLVFDRDCPASVLTGIANYHAMPDVFRPTDAEQARCNALSAWFRQVAPPPNNERTVSHE